MTTENKGISEREAIKEGLEDYEDQERDKFQAVEDHIQKYLLGSDLSYEYEFNIESDYEEGKILVSKKNNDGIDAPEETVVISSKDHFDSSLDSVEQVGDYTIRLPIQHEIETETPYYSEFSQTVLEALKKNQKTKK